MTRYYEFNFCPRGGEGPLSPRAPNFVISGGRGRYGGGPLGHVCLQSAVSALSLDLA
jgi:hypothetical protein